MSKLECEVKRPDVPRQFEVDDTFPVIYSYPSEKAQWVCDYDMDGKLTSVVTGHGERFVRYLETPEEFYSARREIEAEGWIRNKLPKVTVSFREPKVKSAREQKRKKIHDEEKAKKTKRAEEKKKENAKMEKEEMEKRFEELKYDE